MYFKAHTEKL